MYDSRTNPTVLGTAAAALLYAPDSKAAFQVLVLDTNQPTGLDGVLNSVTELVGAPHNYSASESSPTTNQPAEASRPETATTAVTAVAGDALDHAAAESLPTQLTADQVT